MMLQDRCEMLIEFTGSARSLHRLGWRRRPPPDDACTFACNTLSKAGFCLEILTHCSWRRRIDEATMVPIGVLPDSWIAATGRRLRAAAVRGARRPPRHNRACNSQPHWPSVYGGHGLFARAYTRAID